MSSKPQSGIQIDGEPPAEAGELPDDALQPACVLVFNANDASGAGGLAGDVTSIASVGAHALPVVTGAYLRDTREITGHVAFDDEAVDDQARVVLEDVQVVVIKVGFVGTPSNIAVIAEIASDYDELPLVCYLPDLSWWNEPDIEAYQNALEELLLPQTTVLVGNHSTLRRWLLPDWNGPKNPTARDIARAAHAFGVPYTLVTGMLLPDQFIDNQLATPESVLCSVKFERFEAVFTGAGDTLSGALAALIASGSALPEAVNEALTYLDRSLNGGFRPGMGQVIPDRLFWANSDDDDEADDGEQALDDDGMASQSLLDLPAPDTKH